MAGTDFDALLQRQVAMNAATWKALRGSGVTETTRLRLDFFYRAPDRHAADALVALLRAETDYDLGEPSQDDPAGAMPWSVTGSTQQTSISQEILDLWVEWMIAAGRQGGGCAFDGWGAQGSA